MPFGYSALGEERHGLAPQLVFRHRDRRQHALAREIGQLGAVDVVDVDGGRLGQRAVELHVVGDGLHHDLEAEILARLVADLLDRRVGAAGMDQRHILVFCAHTVGNPLTASVATTAPPAAALFRRERRLNLILGSKDLRVMCHLFRHQSHAGSRKYFARNMPRATLVKVERCRCRAMREVDALVQLERPARMTGSSNGPRFASPPSWKSASSFRSAATAG